MSTAKTVAGVVPGIMSVGLVARSLKYLPSEKEMKGKSKTNSFKPVRMFTDVALGVPLIGATSSMVNKLP